MEFTLDIPFIRDILEEEHALARAEIRDLGVLRALENSQQRHDVRIAAAPDVGTLACRAGCTWCCYFTVDVRAAELFRILVVHAWREGPRLCGGAREQRGAQETERGRASYSKRKVPAIQILRPVCIRRGAHVEAVSNAMRDAGYDVNAYELNCALDAALSEPGAREHFESS